MAKKKDAQAEAEAEATEAATAQAAVAAARKRLRKEKKAAEAEAAAAAEKKRIRKEKIAAAQAELEAAEAAEAEAASAAGKKRLRKEKKAAAKAAAETENVAVIAADEGADADLVPKGKRKRTTEGEEEEDPVPKSNKAEKAAATDDVAKVFTAFIGGLPSHVDEAQIKRDFAECGKITGVVLSRWPQDGSSKGLAFITYASEAALQKCVEWNGEWYEGKSIRVEKKEGQDKPKKKDSGLGGQRGEKPEGCKTVAVLEMSMETTEDELWSFFEGCGTIALVKILKHRETYESRGIAFVTFDDTSCTDKAVKLSGQTITGKAVTIQYAAPKNDRDGKGKGKGADGPKVKPEGCTSVVVRNLGPSATEADLWRIFKNCPSANNVSILMDKETFTPKGIAFIDFDDTNDTDTAVRLSGLQLHGQTVTVSYKVPKW